MSEYILQVEDLCFRYGRYEALSHLNFSLKGGHLVGLLGRNGAGKSTLINILLSILRPTSGRALIAGVPPRERPAPLKRLCVVREKALYPPSIRVGQALAACRDLYPNWDAQYEEKLLTLFELNPRKRARQLSRGMESALGLVIGLCSRAPLTIFDEPSLGLDAVARENFYEQLRLDMAAHPRTVIISTHLIDEAAALFDEVLIVNRGRLLIHSRVEDLLPTAVTLSGEESAVRRAAQGHEILHESALNGVCQISVRCAPREQFEGVTAEPLPLQKLFVYLTEGGVAQ